MKKPTYGLEWFETKKLFKKTMKGYCGLVIDMNGVCRENKMRVRTHYELHVPENYRGTNSPKRIIEVDTQEKDDVYYLFHVYLDNPDTQIFVCYNDGTKKRLILE